MKLLRIWLFAVPALVAAMVMARAMSAQGMGPSPRMQATGLRAAGSCSRQFDQHQVLAAIADDGHRVACHRLTVQ